MGTLVCFHAHPDDESIATGGLMARAAAEGHRVVLVTATRGDLGEIMPGVLEDGEQLALRRVAELYRSAEVLGVSRVELLGYVDSGMMGEASNDAPWCFWQADVEHAARRLAAILEEERPDMLTVYDDHGGYGHPDHIQVHRVGLRAAELAGIPGVFQSTMNRDHLKRIIAEQIAAGDLEPAVPDGVSADGVSTAAVEAPAGNGPPPAEFLDTLGSPESLITHAADVQEYAGAKRASMRCHPSQMPPEHFMLAMPDDEFARSMGVEWFIAASPHRPGADGGPLAGLLRPLR